MKEKTLLGIVAALMFLDLLSLTISGIFRLFIPYEIYRVVHPIAGYTLGGLVLIHLILNRKWLKNVLFAKKRTEPANKN